MDICVKQAMPGGNMQSRTRRFVTYQVTNYNTRDEVIYDFMKVRNPLKRGPLFCIILHVECNCYCQIGKVLRWGGGWRYINIT